MSTEEYFSEALRLKEIGNGHFRKKDLKRAYLSYAKGKLKLWKICGSRILPVLDTKVKMLDRDLSMNISLCMFREGDYTYAMEFCNYVIDDLKMNDVKALYRLGECWGMLGVYHAAVKYYSKMMHAIMNLKEEAVKFNKTIEDVNAKLGKFKELEKNPNSRPKPSTLKKFGLSNRENYPKFEEDDIILSHEEMKKTPTERVILRILPIVKQRLNIEETRRKIMNTLPQEFLEVLDEEIVVNWRKKLDEQTKEVVETGMMERILRRIRPPPVYDADYYVVPVGKKEDNIETSIVSKRKRRAMYPLVGKDEDYCIKIYQFLTLTDCIRETEPKNMNDVPKEKFDEYDGVIVPNLPQDVIKMYARMYGKEMVIRNHKLEDIRSSDYRVSQNALNIVFQRVLYLGVSSIRMLEAWWDDVGGMMF